MAWASGIGYFTYNPDFDNLEILIALLGSRNAIPLWTDAQTNVTRQFTFNRNQAVLCKASWTNRNTTVTIFEPEKAAAVLGDQFHGKTLDEKITNEQLDLFHTVDAAIIMSYFGPSQNTTQQTFGREITCLTISDGIIVYYAIGILLLLGSTVISFAGSGEGKLRRSDIPITGMGWVHFVNNIYHPDWKVGVQDNKELYLIPPEEVIPEDQKATLPRVVVLSGNQVMVPPPGEALNAQARQSTLSNITTGEKQFEFETRQRNQKRFSDMSFSGGQQQSDPFQPAQFQPASPMLQYAAPSSAQAHPVEIVEQTSEPHVVVVSHTSSESK